MLRENREDRNEITSDVPPAPVSPVRDNASPHIDNAPALDDAASQEALKLLRRFHLGDRSAAALCEIPDDGHLPAQLHGYRHLRRFRYEYPVLLPPVESADDGQFFISLDEFLKNAVDSFAPGESSGRILKDNLGWLEYWLRDQMTGKQSSRPAAALLKAGTEALRDHLQLTGGNRESLDADLAKLEQCLVPGTLIVALGPNTPFHLLHHVMRCLRAKADAAFRARLAVNVRGLTRLLAVEREKASAGTAESATGMGEGGRYLSPVSFSGIVAHRHQGSVAMSAERRERVMKALTILQAFSGQDGEFVHLTVRPGSLTLGEGNAFRITESDDPCRAALDRYDELARAWAGAFAALRIAELELDDKYDPAIHDSWFQNFDWEAFSDEELRLVPAVVAVETTDHAAGDCMHSVSRLLNARKPVQVAMTVSAHGDPERAANDVFRGFRMELSWFGIGHREAVVNQVSSARLGSLVAGFSSALASTRPSLHLIHTGFTPSQPLHPWIMASAALESRAHPYIRFDPVFVEGGTIDFSGNPSPDDDWVVNEFAYEDAQGQTVTLPLAFTFADYCLLKPELRGEFRSVPRGCASEHLVTVDAYLAAEEAARKSMVPFVWSVDAGGAVRKLVISRALAFACRDRLHFWRDLQSRAGVHNWYVDRAVERVRAEEQAKAAQASEEMARAHAEELEAARTGAAEDIMGRLTDVLMGLDLSDAALRGAPGRAPAAVPVAEPAAVRAEAEVPAPEPAPAPEAEEDDAISFDEPWTDSMLCTSCDDCMAVNKLLFVYNEDKQAVISDPRAGTFEQLVRAAELCPAHCIHPGKPLNPGEPGLPELIKRAEPFN